MKKQRFIEEQIIGVLREQEAGTKAADVSSVACFNTNAICAFENFEVFFEFSSSSHQGS